MEIFKITKNVPQGIRFLSEWNEFNLKSYPAKCIINKQIPGCGMTEYCLLGNEPVVLCSPRKLLLQNKKDQHGDDVYLVVNEMDKDPDVDRDISKVPKVSPYARFVEEKLPDEKELEFKRKLIYERIYHELDTYVTNRKLRGLPPKILVTYDSYHIVVDILQRMGAYMGFYTVVDEFQSILHDARFKSTTEVGFVNDLKRSSSAILVSATPMLDEYISQLDFFKDLPYFQLDWGFNDPTRISKPNLTVKTMAAINSKSKEIIDTYLTGDFESIIVRRDNGVLETVISDEAVFYVNSVNSILNIIKNNKLRPDQVNILCADNEANRKKIRAKLGVKFDIGSIPLRGEKPKMFTFCTRTVYLGADFYSTCARSFIFSDSNVDCLSVDISEDLPQILGRQRLITNPWHNSAEFYYKTTADYKKMTKEDLDKRIEDKEKRTENLLSIYGKGNDGERADLALKYQKDAKNSSYKDDYVAIDKFEEYVVKNDENGVFKELVKDCSLKPVRNELVKVNEIRTFNIQQIDYRDRFAVFSAVNIKFYNVEDLKEVANFFNTYDSLTTLVGKLKLLCECGLPQNIMDIIINQLQDSDHVKSYYTALGPDKLRRLGYNLTYIKKELGIITFTPDLLYSSVYSDFKIGDKLPLTVIKERLANIYNSINYKETPKATDIQNFFKTKKISSYEKNSDGSRKKIHGLELLESYEQQYRDKFKS